MQGEGSRYNAVTAEIVAELRKIVGDQYVIFDDVEKLATLRDALLDRLSNPVIPGDTRQRRSC